MLRTYLKNASFQHLRYRLDQLLLPVLVLAAVSLSLAPNVAGAEEKPVIPDWFTVIDRANLLNEDQERLANDAAWRLNAAGSPAQLVIELAQSTPQLASERATAIRHANAIESAPGADDGILVYAAANPGNRSVVEVAISMGVNAVPRGGLTSETASDLRSTIIEPQLQAGHPARAIIYTLREVHYLQIFAPPPREALDGWRFTLHRVLPVAAPFTAVIAAAFVFDRTRSAGTLRNVTLPLVLAGALAILLAVLSVMSHSRIGILSALLLAAIVIWSAIYLDRPFTHSTERTVRATPRPPGSFRSLSGTLPQ